MAYASYRMSLLPSMTFDEMMAYTTRNNDKALITVGIIRNGETTYTVYGKNGSVLPGEDHVYEIGSLTKTFTAALLCKAISEGKVNLNDEISKYIALPGGGYYPTLNRLVTHISGYKEYYLEWPMITGFLSGQKNSYYGIDREMLVKRLADIALEDKDYAYKYSNFGMAAIGEVLGKVYGASYTKLMDDYLANDLRLEHTRVSDGTGDLSGYWRWKEDDAYAPAGALTSTVSDMMRYIKLQMSGELPYLAQGHDILAQIGATPKQYEKLDIRLDAAGIGWIIDTKNNIIWHNGGTSYFNSYAAFDKEKQIGVVILSNCSPKYRIPSTVMGVKLMKTLQNESGAPNHNKDA
ncbi:CubicO group peptidase, beta-lactamase class C family [Sporobacter termitidis DSM 10068]|uniref:CubicO group peptidase, beta-lactamase class C family n=1 Tax=Sporobacter termitidis DSM 10068 TaxID=1123282 RepID=A0A1M5VD35_9FIRM|nr:serine hydrolase domain-containing protein [Sporobacter termitidis]SHH73137.1 CubicO group peptidase, beta-lactamase class C family [Sporobacter termitidis DSM 10068]